ncbi:MULTISPECIES: hypothetical protein [unclassified Microbacterium]|uniref:RCC1 domain-containing protein n=1 Tax=unclassified Microbacterium TaxID=2609290 RepID=UPI0028831829|nr:MULTISPECIES: hypothetical protein [unclassified Microbacterium]
MILAIRKILAEKKGGVVDALGALTLGLGLIVTVGVLVGNYAIHSKKAELVTTVSQEITNRAEVYASAMNSDLVNPEVPSLARECSTATEVCTQILQVTPGGEGKTMTLRIQGDTLAPLGESVTKDVVLDSVEVSHVTGIDADGNNIWGIAPEEGLRYRTWGVASGEPSVLTAEELNQETLSWAAIADRAGVDSAGGLWVWGPNKTGQAGVGKASADPVAPTRIEVGKTKFRSVTTVADRGFAIDSDGFAWVWGKNDQKQLGAGGSVIMEPTKLPVRVVSITTAKATTLAITSTGELWVQGAAIAGLPTPNADGIVNKGTKYKAVSASASSGAVALVSSAGTVAMYGVSYTLQAPTQPEVFVSVSVGPTAAAGLTSDGKLYTWGKGPAGELAQKTTLTQFVPTSPVPTKKFVSVVMGKSSLIALDANGKLWYSGNAAAAGVTGDALPVVNTLAPLLASNSFHAIAADSSSTAVALLDAMKHLYGFGNTTVGLWPSTAKGSANTPTRMPLPDGFSSYTWK